MSYGKPRHGNPDNPVDDLIYIILSNRTRIETACTVLENLARIFSCWEDVSPESRETIREIIRPAGLSGIKSLQIVSVLGQLKTDFGECSLDKLRTLPIIEVENYLTSLAGVSLKVAKCVMMYTMDFQVLPVDVHVHRIATRLGWIARKRADQSHEDLEELVPKEFRYSFHVDCVAHGVQLCHSRAPNCELCPIRSHCIFYKTTKGYE
ncbi:endonuclease III domain-containing protein [Capsulimonas corticalis]|uniref:endonuclease III domain-containing protein n=1 Tax=Capsulimonas corticalis TaxID=2219043 RepID=UPI00339D5534